MRALLFGLLVAGLLYWWSGSWSGGQGAAEAAAQGQPPVASPARLDDVLVPAASGSGSGSGQAAPLVATGDNVPAVAAPLPSLDDLLPAVQQRDAAAIGAAWALVPKLAGTDRARLVAALSPAAEDLASQLGALGPHNAFLHSAEGRGLAAKVAASVFALGDAEAVPAATALLDLMLKGRILREDAAPRAFVDDVYKQHRIRVDRWLCDPANVAGARSYTIASGDSLARIASRFRKEKIQIEDGTLAILNRIHNPNTIQAGQKIKVPVAPIRSVVEKRSFSLAVYVGDHLLRLYWVGHGEHDRTPVTTFTVGVKQPKPDWTAPSGQVYAYGHPENILGEYFIKLLHESYVGFGAHGTPMPDTICTMSSMGCIRMLGPDIAELFKLLPMGTRFEVRATESMR